MALLIRAPGLAPEASAMRWLAREEGCLAIQVQGLQTAVFRMY